MTHLTEALAKIWLSPSKNLQMEFAAIFVAMSQVKQTDHMHLLYHDTSQEADPSKAFGYLTNLWSHKSVHQYYYGFPTNNGHWDANWARDAFF